ncbi:MAG: glycosyltransferase family 2 protein [Christensenella sp.]|uniref:glycosyltransferase family 2 protein n=1 Tax=Christensenella sp. TaxID=1935934 RepID=UPI002B20E557|nr:glycosyltransferase family 2 protein [Christensenella sp.]MEA5003665.1 glycosyltransferase family 2 protein [Christensenella sp.]
MKDISLIVPCYNEEQNIVELYKASMNVLNQLPISEYEFIFIDDGSSDATLGKLKELQLNDPNVQYISFSRNFGKEAAMLAGLEYSSGDFVAIMDADMQDPPELLLEMYPLLLSEDYDCIGSRRITRKGEPRVRSFFAKSFYRVINKISKIEIVDGARDFRLMKRNMVDALLTLKEKNRFSKGLFVWVGFKTKYLTYENRDRHGGQSKWSFWDLMKYSMDGIISFSTVPLTLVSFLGILCCILSVGLIIFFILQKLIFGNNVDGWASMTTIILLLGGVQLLGIGILGQYLAKIFLEVKGRPSYIIKEHSCTEKEIFHEK